MPYERLEAAETLLDELGNSVSFTILHRGQPVTHHVPGGLGQDANTDEVRGDPGYGDIGGASRFFYCAKASRAERDAGLHGCEETSPTSGGEPKGRSAVKGTDRAAQNNHPTVKPIDLMRWLVRLVTPPGGTVLDPFAGSGSTGAAAMLEGARFLGIEREAIYVPIARARITHWARQTRITTNSAGHRGAAAQRSGRVSAER